MIKSSLKLKKYESIYLEDDKVYTILSGKILARDIFSNGKILNNEIPLSKGDLIGNFFKICEVYEDISKNLAIEIEALEEAELIISEGKVLCENLENDMFGMLRNLIEQMLKKHLITIYHHTYSKKGYMLAVLLLHSSRDGILSKDLLNYENFNLSRSQFFSIMSELKSDLLLQKTTKGVIINKTKAEKYLELEN